MGKITDEILTDLKQGTSNESNVPYVSEEVRQRELDNIRNDIAIQFDSTNKFSNYCAISSSQLSEFLNGKKNFGRDRLLTIFISLKYDFERIQALLHLFQVSELYARNKRDYQIIVGIRDHLSLYDIDELLISKGLEPLSQYRDS